MTSEQIFMAIQAEFYHFMVDVGGLTRKTSHDYISRLRFLSKFYVLDANLTEEKIKQILQFEDTKRQDRSQYTSKKAIGDFSAGLHKFLSFVKFNYQEEKLRIALSEINKINETKAIPITQRQAIIQARVGQGQFRNSLIDYWHGCAVTSCNYFEILVASHIKPWSISNNSERLDVYNGLLLVPNYDKLFDLGYLTFTSDGKALFSSLLPNEELLKAGISKDIHLSNIEESHKPYLEYHNNHCFIE